MDQVGEVAVAVKVTSNQVGAGCFELVEFVTLRAVAAHDRNAVAQEVERKMVAKPSADPRDQHRILAGHFRNSRRRSGFSLNSPPSAMVLVKEEESCTPRDLTQ